MAKTAQQIAADTLAAHAIRPDWRRTGEQIAPLIAEGIEADRAQQAAELREVAERARIRDYAWHRDGEPCLRAMTTCDCVENHRYGRTFESAH
jgi:hypothetical protein